MDSQFKEWFVPERAKALASLLLTRRDDLDVRETKADNGLDFTVHISSETGGGPRLFGVLLRATMSSVTIDEANAQLESNAITSMGPYFFPVCVFYFTVKDNRGYYTWGYEPLVEKGEAKLRACLQADYRALDDKALGEIVSRVSAWYNALSTSLMV